MELYDAIFMANRDKPMLVFITGLEKFINTIPQEIKGDLSGFFNKINELHNCYFILVDRLDDIKPLIYEKWKATYRQASRPY